MTNYFIDILEITLPVSVIILILTALSPLIKRGLVAKWRYFMWLFIAARLAFPFRLIAGKAAIEIPNVMVGVQTAAALSVPAEQGPDLQSLFVLLYFAGILLFFTVQAVCYFDFSARVKRWERNADPYVLGRIGVLKKELGIKKSVKAVICKSVSTPMMTGIFRPKLILPNKVFSERELEVILKHELIHLKNNDILYKLALAAANGLHWFNPAVYLMTYMANRDVELVCDSEVVRGMDMEYRQHYCRTILSLVHKRIGINPPLSTGFAISKRVIKERIEDILSFRLKKRGILLFAVIALSVTATGSVIGIAKENIRQEIEENQGLVERTTPAPKKTAEPAATETADAASVSTTAPAAITSAPPASSHAEAKPAPPKPTAEPPITATESPQSNRVSWWTEDMNMSREALDEVRDGTRWSSEVNNISSGGSASLSAKFDTQQDITLGNVYYVEPNRSMTVYHKGGVVQVADAETGELVYDSTNDENLSESVIEAGDTGTYYRVNISQSDEAEDNVQMYIIEK